MSNETRIFTNEEFGTVRTVVIDDEPWFAGKDVAEALGYKNTKDAIITHVNEEDRKIIQRSEIATIENHLPKDVFSLNFVSGGIPNRGLTFVNESGVYALIFGSKLPSAKKFKHWVTSEVLPSIRKHGAYMTDETLEQALLSPDFLIQLATQLKQEKDARKLAEQKLKEQKPLVDFAIHVTETSDTVDIGEFAKIVQNEHINIGRNRLFVWLREKGYLMSNNIPYQKYMNDKLFEVVEVEKTTPYGTNVYSKTLITGKGQVNLVEKLRKEFAA